eukprot:CAMPEP_0179335766 /NCGR_PEP_ID=MMETSP0797-20121207/66671_1 /TAXON_ID=47934 /ORGANISM="Dinophysis acuminata, Strain DAEP01" /LENGTH=82 /DNA_ID=CAMNT_0021049181 /DNA_START=30 /DNA_END=275 /DNA_ORIENTATION=-
MGFGAGGARPSSEPAWEEVLRLLHQRAVPVVGPEVRRPLLEEGLHALLAVLGLERLAHQGVRLGERLAELQARVRVDLPLDH